MRLALSLGVVAFFLLCVAGMWWGYRNRGARQASTLPAFPEVPAGLLDRVRGEDTELTLPPLTGVYASTTTAADWQDRVALGDIGFRSAVTAYLVAEGVLLDRTGASPLWIPRSAVLGARTGGALAGKVIGGDGLLIVRWSVGEREFDTGLRADDKDSYAPWIAALAGGAGVRPGETGDTAR